MWITTLQDFRFQTDLLTESEFTNLFFNLYPAFKPRFLQVSKLGLSYWVKNSSTFLKDLPLPCFQLQWWETIHSGGLLHKSVWGNKIKWVSSKVGNFKYRMNSTGQVVCTIREAAIRIKGKGWLIKKESVRWWNESSIKLKSGEEQDCALDLLSVLIELIKLPNLC